MLQQHVNTEGSNPKPWTLKPKACCAGRGVYGPSGMLQQHVKAEGKKGMRQSPQRVAELVLRAMHHRVLLCWIVQHPILLLGMPGFKGLQPGRQAGSRIKWQSCAVHRLWGSGDGQHVSPLQPTASPSASICDALGPSGSCDTASGTRLWS